MKVLILNGAKKGDIFIDEVGNLILDELRQKNHNVMLVNLRDKVIASCLGCFGCWIKTPGICVIDDEGREIAKNVVQSDLVVTLTPITFGGYSYQLKKALDRLIPIISPFFMKIKGEVHHKPRYTSYPKLISIGTLKQENKEMVDIFSNLTIRNAINLHNEVYLRCVLYENQSVEEVREEILKLLREGGA